MKNTGKSMPLLMVVLSLALAGLMALQGVLLKYTWDLKEQAFVRGVKSALSATVLALESQEIEGSAHDYLFRFPEPRADGGTATARQGFFTADRDSERVRRGRVRHQLHRLRGQVRRTTSSDSLTVVMTTNSVSGADADRGEILVRGGNPATLRSASAHPKARIQARTCESTPSRRRKLPRRSRPRMHGAIRRDFRISSRRRSALI